MALNYPNVVEAMGLFDVVPGTPAVVAFPGGFTAGFNPVGAYIGVGHYSVSLSEERAKKVAVVSPLSGIFVEGTTIDVDVFGGFPANSDIIIRVGGIAAAPVELAAFSIIVFNMPSGI